MPRSPLNLRIAWDSGVIQSINDMKIQKSVSERLLPFPRFQPKHIEPKQCTPYSKSILRSYRQIENSLFSRNNSINTKLTSQALNDRFLITEWMVEFCISYKINHNVTSVAIKLFDYINSIEVIPRDKAKLHTGTCIFIANKLEGEDFDEICSFLVEDLENIVLDDIVQTELHILHLIRFNARFITPQMYIEQMIDIQENSQLYQAVIVPILYCLMTTKNWIEYRSEELAIAVIEIVKYILEIPNFITNLECFTAVFLSIRSCLSNECSFISQKFDNLAEYFKNCEL